MGEIVARLIFRGDVQGVGYRASVKYIAKKMGIRGFVKNLDDCRVEIRCKSSRKNIEGFVEAVVRKADKPDEFSLNVEDIEARYEGEEGFVEPEMELGVFDIDRKQK